jgi:Protein of unknown function (DUF2490).
MGLRSNISVRHVVRIFVFQFFIAISFGGFSQEKDFGSWIDIDITHKLGKCAFGLLGEFYTKDRNESVDRVSVGAKGDYQLAPGLNVGTGYLLMNYCQQNLREVRNRVYLQTDQKKYLSNWAFSLRERMQLTLIPARKEKKHESSLYWRNRIRVEYRNEHLKIEPVFDIESFCLINRLSCNGIDEYRYSLGFNYKLKNYQKIKFYGLISYNNTSRFYALGLDYSLKL